MVEVLQEGSATIFMDRRLLYVGVRGAMDELDSADFGARLSSLPHGCLVLPRTDGAVLVRAQVLSGPPPRDPEAEVASFDVVEGELVITNPLAGGQISFTLPDGRWNLTFTQVHDDAPLDLALWPSPSATAPVPLYRPDPLPPGRSRELRITFDKGAPDLYRLDSLTMMLGGFAGFGHVDYQFTHDAKGAIRCEVRSDLSESKLQELAEAISASLAYLSEQLGPRVSVVPGPA